MPMPAAKLGLAFVGWTRATTWTKIAFESLPPLDQFLAMRQQPAFKSRCCFEEKADRLHDAFLNSRGVDENQHIKAHHEHLARQLRSTENRVPTAYELEDVAHMLNQRGVAPVSDSVMKWAQQQTGRSSGFGLTAILDAFRRDRRLRDAGDKARSKSGPPPGKKRENTDSSTLSFRVTKDKDGNEFSERPC